jgi:protein involved in polysaccharide export with SLBB domain
MRYTFFLVVAVLFLSFPLRIHAADNSDTAYGSVSSRASATGSAFSTLPSVMGPISITTVPSAIQSPREIATSKEEIETVIPEEIASKAGSFQFYVASSTGTDLNIFGRELFGKVPSTYAPLSGVQVNGDYVIGSGDVLQIRGWGMVDIDVNVTVNRSGEIYLPRVGSVNVAGVKYRDLQGYLKKAVGRIFTNFELSASVAQTRSVQIYVLGHARRPGTYTLSAMSSLLNALFASGGPSPTGTMRDIQLKRGNAPAVSIDLYDMLLYGDKSMDRALQDGDVIYIPEVGPLVALLGNIKRPAIFELKKKTSLSEIVNWAGGFESAADLKHVIVEKSVANRYQSVAELQADKASIAKKLSRIILNSTDIIRVFAPGTIPFQVKVERAFVLIDGAVKQPGVYQIGNNETLKGLITRIGGVDEKGFVYGTVLTRESVRRAQQVQVNEAVERFEKDFDSSYRERLARESDPIQTAMIQKQMEFQRGIISKLRSFKAEGRIILGLKAFDCSISDLPDFPLKDGDKIFMPEKSTTVSVLGSVYQQNTFIYKPGDRLDDYLEKAGGVSSSGDKSMAYRISADGTVQSRDHGGWRGSVNPGDAIVLPEKFVKGGPGLTSILKDWTSILYQFGIGAAGLKSLRN